MVGNFPNFTKLDVLKCFLKFGKKISRNELSKELGLGEGTVRTILNILKEKNLLDSTKKGHFLNNRGMEVLNAIGKDMEGPKKAKTEKNFPHSKIVAILLRKGNEIKNAYKLRDLAVKEKAEGALILRFNNKLHAPESEYDKDFDELENLFAFKNGDFLVVAFADNEKHAESGALAVAAELNDELKSFLNQF